MKEHPQITLLCRITRSSTVLCGQLAHDETSEKVQPSPCSDHESDREPLSIRPQHAQAPRRGPCLAPPREPCERKESLQKMIAPLYFNVETNIRNHFLQALSFLSPCPAPPPEPSPLAPRARTCARRGASLASRGGSAKRCSGRTCGGPRQDLRRLAESGLCP